MATREKIYLYDYSFDPKYKYDKYTSEIVPYRYADTPEGIVYWEDNPYYKKNGYKAKSVYDFPGSLNLYNLGASGTTDNNSADTVDNSDSFNLGEYLNNLFSTVGQENQANREFNSAEAAAQRDWSSAEAAANRSWQEKMSNTAYTRAVNDLKQAGLNPILAVGGMSSTPSGAVLAGSTASYQTGGGDRASDILNALANSASAVSDVLTFFLPKLSKLLK